MIHRSEAAALLPVVAGEDCVVGSARRDEVHQKGLRHRAVHVLIFDGGVSFFSKNVRCIKKAAPACGILR